MSGHDESTCINCRDTPGARTETAEGPKAAESSMNSASSGRCGAYLGTSDLGAHTCENALPCAQHPLAHEWECPPCGDVWTFVGEPARAEACPGDALRGPHAWRRTDPRNATADPRNATAYPRRPTPIPLSNGAFDDIEAGRPIVPEEFREMARKFYDAVSGRDDDVVLDALARQFWHVSKQRRESAPLPASDRRWPGTRKQMTRSSYEKLVAEDLEWLAKQPSTLEARHIRAIVEMSIEGFYGPSDCAPVDRIPGAKRCPKCGAGLIANEDVEAFSEAIRAQAEMLVLQKERDAAAAARDDQDFERAAHSSSPPTADEHARAQDFLYSDAWNNPGKATKDVDLVAGLIREIRAEQREPEAFRVAAALEGRAAQLDECQSWKEARDISKELRRFAAEWRRSAKATADKRSTER